jgi:excisionase family DNA binding protein
MSALSIGKAARELGLHPDTVRAYLQAGKLDGWRLPSGHWRIESDVVRAFKGRTRLEKSHVAAVASEILSHVSRPRGRALSHNKSMRH